MTNVIEATQEVLVSVVGKLNGVLIKRDTAGTECAIGKEQCEFRKGRRCMDQVFDISIVLLLLF